MKYCVFCGAQNRDEAAFCLHCGKEIRGLPAGGSETSGLVFRARRGDQQAIAALYEETYSKVYYTVKAMIRDEDAVFDILQDAYVKAFSGLDRFEGEEKFLPWIRQIAANTARDWLKKKKPMLFSELNTGEENETAPEEMFEEERTENLPEQALDEEETKRLIREIIDGLPEDQRAAIGMFYYEEMSVREIAEAMGASESAVKSRLMYGRKKIEQKVRELEKRGTKLYGLAPIPFLLLLFRSQKALAAGITDPLLLQGILGETAAAGAGGAGVAAQAASAAAKAAFGAKAAAAGTYAAGAAGVSAVKAAVIGIAAAAVVGGGAFGITRLVERGTGPSADTRPETQIVQEADAAGGEKIVPPGEAAGTDIPWQDLADADLLGQEGAGGDAAELPGDPEQMLREYLEQTLIPAYGIYELEQRVYTADAGMWWYLDRTFHPESGTLDEVHTYYEPSDYNAPVPGINENGILTADLSDTDGDGVPELLVIRSEDTADRFKPNTYVELYDASSGSVEQTGAYLLEGYGPTPGGWGSARQRFSRAQFDGEECLFISRNDFRSDVSFRDSYLLLSLNGGIRFVRSLVYSDAPYDPAERDQHVIITERYEDGTETQEKVNLYTLMATGDELTPITAERWGLDPLTELCEIATGLELNEFMRLYYGK